MHESNQNQSPKDTSAPANVSPAVPEKPYKSKFWKFAMWFVAIIVVAGAALWLVDYFSPEARSSRETQRNYERYEQAMREMEATLRADTYGGATPQETLDLFVDALRKGDVELASRYFAFETGGPNSFDRSNILEALKQEKDKNSLNEIAGLVDGAIPQGELENYTWYKRAFVFHVLDQNRNVKSEISLVFNHLSKVWKIQSL